MRTVRLLFLKAVEGDHWINRLVSRVDPPFCHVELEFDMTDGAPQGTACDLKFFANVCGAPKDAPQTVATSIFAGESVFIKTRTFANPNYTILTLEVSDQAFSRMYAAAHSAAKRGDRFSSAAMLRSWLPCCCCCNTLPPGRTFCSAYVTALLQQGGVQEVRGLNPANVRPSSLFRLLQDAPRQCFSSVPYKVASMTYPASHHHPTLEERMRL